MVSSWANKWGLRDALSFISFSLDFMIIFISIQLILSLEIGYWLRKKSLRNNLFFKEVYSFGKSDLTHLYHSYIVRAWRSNIQGQKRKHTNTMPMTKKYRADATPLTQPANPPVRGRRTSSIYGISPSDCDLNSTVHVHWMVRKRLLPLLVPLAITFPLSAKHNTNHHRSSTSIRL